MENFTAIFLASCGLGVVETIVVWNKGSAELIDPIMFVIVIVALLLQRRNTRVARRGPGDLELAERGERAADPPRADARCPR